MGLTPLLLSRLQFAFTISFHIIFPAFTIGLAGLPAAVRLLAENLRRRRRPRRRLRHRHGLPVWNQLERIVATHRTNPGGRCWAMRASRPLRSKLRSSACFGFGHLVGDFVHDAQPAKLAAIKGRWNDQQPASEILIAWPDEKAEANRFEIAIPYLGSLIGSMNLTSKEIGSGGACPRASGAPKPSQRRISLKRLESLGVRRPETVETYSCGYRPASSASRTR
jgi:hypothetical protein